ncbi:uncharacterized protein LOC119740048 [Patiria miniata]|uniref:TATA box-binding protein-associated factor RNA polymerase I subunit B n=1 Tax=Patiria miniata TaxID=46514 RepID=A0A914B6U0_PATMI|nr:uncharacterized protein LOC119740048 [Patiria miniata]
MPTCGNCRQEVDFYEHGGLFYCNECDTQSQVMHVIEEDRDYSGLQGFSHFTKYYKTSVKKKVTEDKTDGEPEERSWWSCELYQAILKAQVQALLALGFPSRLDEIVMQLWFRFLSKSGAAFCETPKADDANTNLQDEANTNCEDEANTNLEDEEKTNLEDEANTNLEDEANTNLEDEASTNLEDEADSNLEDEANTNLEDEEKTNLEDEANTNLEDEANTNLEDGANTNLEDEANTNLEDEANTNLEDEANTNLEDEANTNLEDEANTNLEDEANTNLEDGANTNLEDEANTNLEDEANTNLEDEANTNLEDEASTNLEDEANTNLEDEENTNLEDEANTNLEDEASTNLEDEANTNLEDEENTNLEDEANTNLEDEASTNLEDEASTNLEDEENTNLEDEANTNLEDEASTNLEDEASTNLEDEENTNLEDEANTNLEDEASTNLEDEASTNLEDEVDSNEEWEKDAAKTLPRTKREKVGKRKGNSVCKDEWLSRLKIPKIAPRSEGKKVLLSSWDSVCFMYIGLQALKEHVLLSDLLRWVRQGHLPLRSTADVLPEHISKGMGKAEIARFCNPVVYLPDVNHVFGLLKQLSAELDLIPQPLSLTEMGFLLARAIHTLNLPKELCQYTHRLSLQAPPSKLEDPLSNPISPECQALAYVVVALKFLFGLDDDNEHMVSCQTKQLQSLLPAEVHLFNWDVWVEAQKLRLQQKLSREGSVHDARDLNKVRNMPGFVQHFKSFYQVEPIYKHLFIWTNYRRGRQEKLKEYQRPFLSLNKESNSSPQACPAPSSFATARPTPKSAQSDHLDCSSPSGNDEDHPKPATGLKWVSRDYLLHEDFSSHTLKHLTNLRELCEQHIIPPTDVFKALDQATEEFRSRSRDSTEPRAKKSESTKVKSSSESSRTGKESARENGKHSCDNGDTTTEDSEDGLIVPSGEDRCSETSELLRETGLGSQNTPYVTYPTCSQSVYFMKPEHQLDYFHRSMAWLLDLCSQMWETDTKRKFISRCVRRVESVLFSDGPRTFGKNSKV